MKGKCFDWHNRLSTLNRTSVELKYDSNSLFRGFGLPLIVPQWNWNMSMLKQIAFSPGPLIVPQWNWNFGRRSLPPMEGEPLIVPQWNWNEQREQPEQSEQSALNRTSVELKCDLRPWVLRAQRSLNRTSVELKCDLRPWVLRAQRYP